MTGAHLTDDDVLRNLVDQYLAARLSFLLKRYGLQDSAVGELDAAARAEELRDYFRANPRAVWRFKYDAEPEAAEEAWWDSEALLKELDHRARETCESIAESRGVTLPEPEDDHD